MTEAEKSNERQAAYSRILEVVRAMEGQVTKNRLLKVINFIAAKDDAWKQLQNR